MKTPSKLIADTYKPDPATGEGQFLRVWSIDEATGDAVCLRDAYYLGGETDLAMAQRGVVNPPERLDLEDPDDAATIAGIQAANAEVLATIEAVEALEAAQRLTAQEEPPRGDPRRTAWLAAETAVAEADKAVVALAEKRRR